MAVKYFMNGGVDNNWNSATNWSTTSSAGPNNTTKGTTTDDVILDAGSPNCTVNGSNTILSLNGTGYTGTFTASSALTISTGGATFDSSATVTVGINQTWTGPLNLAGYTGTFTINATLTVVGAITLGAGMTDAGTGILRAGATGTMTSNGHAWAGTFQLSGTSQTFTLADAWVVGTLGTAGGGVQILNAQSMSAGSLTHGTTVGITGTTPITLTGGTWTGGTTAVLSSSVILDGNVVISGVIRFGAVGTTSPTLTYNSGTITTSGSTLEVQGSTTGTTTFNCNGVTFNTVSLIGNVNNVALTSALQCVTLLIGLNTTCTFSGTAGWTADYFTTTNPTASVQTITLAQAQTYTVTTAMTVQGGSATFYRTIASSSGTDKVPLILNNGAGQDVRYVRATRVDSSGGQTIHSFGIAAADISTSLNWDIVGGGFMWLG